MAGDEQRRRGEGREAQPGDERKSNEEKIPHPFIAVAFALSLTNAVSTSPGAAWAAVVLSAVALGNMKRSVHDARKTYTGFFFVMAMLVSLYMRPVFVPDSIANFV